MTTYDTNAQVQAKFRRADIIENLTFNFFFKYHKELKPKRIPNPTKEQIQIGLHPPDIEIIVDGKKVGLEIKEDIFSSKSGNISFEKKGLFATEKQGGDMVLYFVRKTCTVIAFDLHKLVKELESNEFKKYIKEAGNITKAGNPNWIIPLSEIRDMNSYISKDDCDFTNLSREYLKFIKKMQAGAKL